MAKQHHINKDLERYLGKKRGFSMKKSRQRVKPPKDDYILKKIDKDEESHSKVHIVESGSLLGSIKDRLSSFMKSFKKEGYKDIQEPKETQEEEQQPEPETTASEQKK